ncbi:MAG TPA: hypothetical protein VMI33_00385 [Streptosporangiaceae bacterium]|nr:hypothetical protein [Streptosporangiaceae bacterium]
MAGNPFDSCTGRAISARDDRPADAGRATILITAPQCRPPAGPAIAALASRGFRVLISSGLSDSFRFNLIKAGIAPADLAPEALGRLQSAVESDPGILLTVDSERREVRARGRVLARFEDGGDAGDMAGRLLMTQRLLGSAGLDDGDRVRLQRRLVAICDALKAPGADAARGAWRLDRLLADISRAADRGRQPGQGPLMNFPFP